VHDHLLKSQRGDIAHAIEESGLPPEEFSSGQIDGRWVGLIGDTVPAVHHRDGYYFAFGDRTPDERYIAAEGFGHVPSGDHHVLMHPGPENTYFRDGSISWALALQYFRAWLQLIAREKGRSSAPVAPAGPKQTAGIMQGNHTVPLDPHVKFEQVTIQWIKNHVPTKFLWAACLFLCTAFGAGIALEKWSKTLSVPKLIDEDTRIHLQAGDMRIRLDSIYEPFRQETVSVEVRALTGIAALTRDAKLLGVQTDTANLFTSATVQLVTARPRETIVRADRDRPQFIELTFDVTGVIPQPEWVARFPEGSQRLLGEATVRIYFDWKTGRRDSSDVRVPIVLTKPHSGQ
jgi:hypothetical protein